MTRAAAIAAARLRRRMPATYSTMVTAVGDRFGCAIR